MAFISLKIINDMNYNSELLQQAMDRYSHTGTEPYNEKTEPIPVILGLPDTQYMVNPCYIVGYVRYFFHPEYDPKKAALANIMIIDNSCTPAHKLLLTLKHEEHIALEPHAELSNHTLRICCLSVKNEWTGMYLY